MLGAKDVGILSKVVTSILNPAFPYLINKDSHYIDGRSNSPQNDTWEIAQILWKNLIAEVDKSPSLQQMIQASITSPLNGKFNNSLSLAIEQILEENPILAQNLFNLLGGDQGLKNISNGKIYREALVRWITDASKSLSTPSRNLFHFLCAIDEDDRKSGLIIDEWENILHLFGSDNLAVALEDALSPLLDRGLINERSEGENQFEYILDKSISDFGIAEIESATSGHIYAYMAALWFLRCTYVFGLNQDQIGDRNLLLHVAMKAINYQRKLENWSTIYIILNDLLKRDVSSRYIRTHRKGLGYSRQSYPVTWAWEKKYPALSDLGLTDRWLGVSRYELFIVPIAKYLCKLSKPLLVPRYFKWED